MEYKITNVTKRIMSMLLSALMVTIIFSKEPLTSDVYAVYKDVDGYSDFSVNKYLADMITDEEDSMYKTLAFKLDHETPATILANEFNKNSGFQAAVALWKVGTFKPSNAIDDCVKETDYYEAIILNSLKAYCTTSYTKTVLDNQYIKNSKSLFKNFQNVSKALYGKEFLNNLSDEEIQKVGEDVLKALYGKEFLNDLSDEEIQKAGEEKISECFNKAFKMTYKNTNKINDFIKNFNVLVKVCKNLEQSLNNIAAYYECCNMSENLKKIVSDMYNSYHGKNPFLKEALLKVKTAAESCEMAFDVSIYDLTGRIFIVAFDYAIDELFTKLISSTFLGTSLLIGQAVGQGLSNFFFSTDATIEQYLKISAFNEVETVMKNITAQYIENYRTNPTEENAENLFCSIDVLYTNYGIGCDYAQKMADLVFTDNNYKKIVSLVIPQNDEGYNEFTKSISQLKEMNEQSLHYLMVGGFLSRFSDEYSEIYNEFVDGTSYKDEKYIPVYSIEFQQESVEWGLNDTWLINGDININPVNATNKGIVYTSSDPLVITYDIFGFKVHKPGNAVITATSLDNGVTATLNVKVVEGNGTDGMVFKDYDEDEVAVKYGDEFTVGNNTYSVLSVGDSYGTVGIKYGKPNNWGIVYVPEKVCYKNKLFTVTKVLNGKSKGTGAIIGAFTNGGSYMRWNTNVKKIILPGTIKYIGLYAFNYVMGLQSLEIPEGVETISSAFSFCGIERITLPQSLKSLSISPVYNYEQYFKLKDIYYYGTKENWEDLSRYSDVKNATVHILHMHRYSGSVTKQATCSSFGEMTYTCVCGDYYIENIDMLPHIYSEEWTIDIEPTYESDGEKSHHCKNCNDRTDITVIPKLEYEILYSGKCGENVYYDCYSNGLYHVYGNGSMYDYDLQTGTQGINAPSTSPLKYAKSAIIDSGVTSLGNNTFRGSPIEYILIGDDVNSIGEGSLYNCKNLKKVTIGKNLKEIKSFAFSYSNNIEEFSVSEDNQHYKSVDGNLLSKDGIEFIKFADPYVDLFTIPDGVKTIGVDSFADNLNLKTVIIPDGLTEIQSYAFDGCKNLSVIKMPDTVCNISGAAFSDTEWYNNQPDGDVYIGKVYYAYKGTMPENTGVIIKDGTKGIADSAFSNCKGLTSITIPNGVISIGSSAFSNCKSLTSITIPNSVQSIDSYVFSACKGLASIVIPNSVTKIGDYAFEYCSGLTSVTIPDSLTSIGNGVFWHCSSLTSIVIPDSVTSIGEQAFKDCNRLTSIDVSKNNSAYSSDYGVLLNKDKTVIMCCPEGKKGTYTIPSSVTKIGDYAFYDCDKLTSVEIPDSVTSIGKWAFEYCSSLISITIPDSVTSIGDGVFWQCSSLTNIVIPSSITSIGDGAFGYCKGLTRIVIPDSVILINIEAFDGCNNLKIYGVKDSYAETFAKENNIPFVELGQSIAGDTSGDESVDIADALMIARYDAGLIQLDEIQLSVSDVNADDSVDIADALMIARYDAGLINSL